MQCEKNSSRRNKQGVVVPDDVEDSSKLPSRHSQRFRSTYCYGYLFRAKSAEECMNGTCDSKVFFSDDEDELGWRVVLRTKVRDRRVDSAMEGHEEPEMFAMGHDQDFEGLRAPANIPETNPDPLP